jgi:hypothetical protein
LGGPALALVYSAAAAMPLLVGAGYLHTRGGGDSPFLLFRLHQLVTGLQDGAFPVRWMPDAALGLGYPFFNYYAALPYYLAAGFKFAGLAYVQSIELTQLLGFLLAGWGVYTWVHQAGYSRPAAWLAAAAYSFAPFHLVNVYVRGDSLSEFWAFAWYPLILLAALRLARRPSWRRALPLALAYAALVLTHNISALIFTPFLGLYVVGLLAIRDWRLEIRVSQAPISNLQSPLALILHSLLALALAVCLSAFFWLPALLEGGYGQLGPVTQGYFNYAEHFRGFNLVQTSLLFNYDIGAQGGGPTPFALGLVQAMLIVAGLAGLGLSALRGRFNPHDVFAVVGLAGATFMITPLSRPLWDALPLLPFVQFPWRFLSVQSLFAAAVIARSIAPLEFATSAAAEQSPAPASARTTPLPSLVSLALAAVLGLFTLPIGRGLNFIPIADGDVTAQRLQLYEYFTGNIGTTIRHEYLPRWTTPRPYTSDELLLREPRVKALAGEASGARTEKGTTWQTWRVSVDTPQAVIAVPLLYWPGWTAQVDGRDTRLSAAPGLGWMALVVPEGDHTVTFELGRTFVRIAGEAISLVAWAAVVIMAALLLRRSAFTLVRCGVLAAIPLGIGVVMALLSLASGQAAPVIGLTADFDQLAYYSRVPVRFAGGARLAGYDYSGDRVARGGAVQVTTLWAGLAGDGQAAYSATLELVPPPAPLRAADLPLATAQFEPSAAAVASINIPTSIAPGVYLLRLRLDAGNEAMPAFTPAGQPRGALYLRPIWIDDPGPGSPLEADGSADFGPSVRLLGVNAVQATPETLKLELVWEALGDVPQNYALALRLNDGAGGEWAALDTQPAFGFYPTGLWRLGEIVPDTLALPYPLGTPPGEYQLTLTLYDVDTLEPIGRHSETVALEVAAPAAAAEVRPRLIDSLGLSGVELPASIAQGEPLNLTAKWITLSEPPDGLQARWLLIDEDGNTSYSETAPLSAVSDSGDWPARALILGRASLQLPAEIEPGNYGLALDLLGQDGVVLAQAGELGSVEVAERERLDAPPASARRLEAAFGDSLGLVAYELSQSSSTLILTPYWSARARPESSFKYFVHLFDSESEQIVAQADDFPQGGAYPTTQWAEGEVVSDTITINLANVPPGSYRVALGWYNPDDPAQRLPALDDDGNPLELNRVVLPEEIEVR